MQQPEAVVYPARVDVPWDEVDERVVLAVPRQRTRLELWIDRLVPTPPDALVSLEGEAAAAWRLADGTRTMAEIGALVGAPARVARFVQEFARRGFLRLQEAPARAADARQGLTEELGYRRVACRRCRVAQPLRAPPGAAWICPRCRRPNRVARA